jgi:hypothetical protein
MPRIAQERVDIMPVVTMAFMLTEYGPLCDDLIATRNTLMDMASWEISRSVAGYAEQR